MVTRGKDFEKDAAEAKRRQWEDLQKQEAVFKRGRKETTENTDGYGGRRWGKNRRREGAGKKKR